jgi:hypothetical protein
LDPIHAISSFITAHSKFILDVGKIILALIMLFFSLLGVLIIINFAILRRKLQAMELSANQTREEAVILFAQARAGLKGLHGSLAGETTYDTRELLRSGGQLVMLLLGSERNLMTWGILGFQMAKGALRYFFSRRQ